MWCLDPETEPWGQNPDLGGEDGAETEERSRPAPGHCQVSRGRDETRQHKNRCLRGILTTADGFP